MPIYPRQSNPIGRITAGSSEVEESCSALPIRPKCSDHMYTITATTTTTILSRFADIMAHILKRLAPKPPEDLAVIFVVSNVTVTTTTTHTNTLPAESNIGKSDLHTPQFPISDVKH